MLRRQHLLLLEALAMSPDVAVGAEVDDDLEVERRRALHPDGKRVVAAAVRDRRVEQRLLMTFMIFLRLLMCMMQYSLHITYRGLLDVL